MRFLGLEWMDKAFNSTLSPNVNPSLSPEHVNKILSIVQDFALDVSAGLHNNLAQSSMSNDKLSAFYFQCAKLFLSTVKPTWFFLARLDAFQAGEKINKHKVLEFSPPSMFKMVAPNWCPTRTRYGSYSFDVVPTYRKLMEFNSAVQFSLSSTASLSASSDSSSFQGKPKTLGVRQATPTPTCSSNNPVRHLVARAATTSTSHTRTISVPVIRRDPPNATLLRLPAPGQVLGVSSSASKPRIVKVLTAGDTKDAKATNKIKVHVCKVGSNGKKSLLSPQSANQKPMMHLVQKDKFKPPNFAQSNPQPVPHLDRHSVPKTVQQSVPHFNRHPVSSSAHQSVPHSSHQSLLVPCGGAKQSAPHMKIQLVSIGNLQPVSPSNLQHVPQSISPCNHPYESPNTFQSVPPSNLRPASLNVEPVKSSNLKPVSPGNLQSFSRGNIQPVLPSNPHPVALSKPQPVPPRNIQSVSPGNLQPVPQRNLQSKLQSVSPRNLHNIQSSNLLSVSPSNIQPVPPSNLHPVSPSNLQPVSLRNFQSVSPSNPQSVSPSNIQAVSHSNLQPVSPSKLKPVSPSNFKPAPPAYAGSLRLYNEELFRWNVALVKVAVESEDSSTGNCLYSDCKGRPVLSHFAKHHLTYKFIPLEGAYDGFLFNPNSSTRQYTCTHRAYSSMKSFLLHAVTAHPDLVCEFVAEHLHGRDLAMCNYEWCRSGFALSLEGMQKHLYHEHLKEYVVQEERLERAKTKLATSVCPVQGCGYPRCLNRQVLLQHLAFAHNRVNTIYRHFCKSNNWPYEDLKKRGFFVEPNTFRPQLICTTCKSSVDDSLFLVHVDECVFHGRYMKLLAEPLHINTFTTNSLKCPKLKCKKVCSLDKLFVHFVALHSDFLTALRGKAKAPYIPTSFYVKKKGKLCLKDVSTPSEGIAIEPIAPDAAPKSPDPEVVDVDTEPQSEQEVFVVEPSADADTSSGIESIKIVSVRGGYEMARAPPSLSPDIEIVPARSVKQEGSRFLASSSGPATNLLKSDRRRRVLSYHLFKQFIVFLVKLGVQGKAALREEVTNLSNEIEFFIIGDEIYAVAHLNQIPLFQQVWTNLAVLRRLQQHLERIKSCITSCDPMQVVIMVSQFIKDDTIQVADVASFLAIVNEIRQPSSPQLFDAEVIEDFIKSQGISRIELLPRMSVHKKYLSCRSCFSDICYFRSNKDAKEHIRSYHSGRNPAQIGCIRCQDNPALFYVKNNEASIDSFFGLLDKHQTSTSKLATHELSVVDINCSLF